ncbi:carboxylesterase type B [Acidovorax sp. 69]|uniref:carboxylesterase/lipase family protein n=1 Tax=Acidovorax sp. 69 TaxID=2035202 RepID=UPI000CAF305A|nr:carboxylesterase family protein [Acidovorax sp. 69]PJI95315.1 carboxylesterase type B [Acidovorax sp. 69]
MTSTPPWPEVVLPHGGRLRGAWAADGVRVFRGVPYAQAPFGALRFAAPVPVPPWSGVRDACDFAPMAPQLARHARPDALPLGGEDCLAVNVWAPACEPGSRLPVMVWVHGGGFFRGAASDPLYDGTSFARQGVVWVSLQYRLGVDGFVQLDGAPANRGLLDQLAALQWVQQSIAAWGGDPARVTVCGQSAGAGALACLLGMPASRGLFSQAILQSPSVACQTMDEAAAARDAVAQLAGVAPTRAGLQQAPLKALLHAVHRLAAEPALRAQHGLGGRNFFPLRPVVDGQVLQAPPLQAMRTVWMEHPALLRVLVGSNADEMHLYHVPGGAIDRVTDAQVQAFAQDVGLPLQALQTYRAHWPAEREPSPGELLSALQSDYYYRVPAMRIASLASDAAMATYRYSFEWASPQWRGRLGAAHAVELPFVLGNLTSAQGLEFTGPSPRRICATPCTVRGCSSHARVHRAGRRTCLTIPQPRYSTRPVAV